MMNNVDQGGEAQVFQFRKRTAPKPRFTFVKSANALEGFVCDDGGNYLHALPVVCISHGEVLTYKAMLIGREFVKTKDGEKLEKISEGPCFMETWERELLLQQMKDAGLPELFPQHLRPKRGLTLVTCE